MFTQCLSLGTESNSKKKRNGEEPKENNSRIRKGVAYFIIVKSGTVEDEVRRVVCSAGFKSQLSYIIPRGVDRKATDSGLKQLKSVMKV